LNWEQPLTWIALGGVVGLTSAVIGAFIDFQLSKKRAEDDPRLPGCMLLIAGFLGFAGVIALIGSFIFGVSIQRPLLTGAGVIGGFFIGFTLLLVMWLWANKMKR
jgi:membrane associated rhomboid family serine protease